MRAGKELTDGFTRNSIPFSPERSTHAAGWRLECRPRQCLFSRLTCPNMPVG